MKLPPKTVAASERKKAEKALLEAALAYGHALHCQEEVLSDVAAKWDEARELVDGAGGRLQAAAQAYFLANAAPRPPAAAPKRGRKREGTE
jgi:hypothetical protein